MARVNLAAYTAPGPNYPEYVSINREDNGKVSISVRGAPVYQGLDAQGINKYLCGPTVCMELDPEELMKLVKACGEPHV